MRWEIRRVLYALCTFLMIVVLGGFGLWGLGEHEYSLGDCIYFALITAATVGFAELPDITQHYGMRIVTGILIVSGVGAIALFQSALTAVLVEGVIAESFRSVRDILVPGLARLLIFLDGLLEGRARVAVSA